MNAHDDIADVLSRAYDGTPLADLRDEHAAHHRQAAEALTAAGLTDRAEVLREAADAIDVPGDTCTCGGCDSCAVRAAARLLRAMADAAGKDTPAGGESTPSGGFFQPGRTYRSPHDGFTAPELILTFRVEHVTRHPDRGHLRAIGWMRTGEPGTGWHGDFRDEDEADGWTEVTEGCDVTKCAPAAASNAGHASTT